MSRCAYYTDGQHRATAEPGPPTCACGAAIPASIFDTAEAPARKHDPHPSRQAAARATPKAGSQARRILEAIVAAGGTGASTRELQRALFRPADPAWNKVATRCKWLEGKGLATRREETRPEAGQHFLVYEATADGYHTITGGGTP